MMNLRIIYIIAPANFATGGTEDLHQLGFELKAQGHNVLMYYVNKKEGTSPIPDRYKKYDIPIANLIEDNANNLLIVPEGHSEFITLRNYRKVQKAVWWLSVDFFYIGELNNDIRVLPYRAINILYRKLGLREPLDVHARIMKLSEGYNLIEHSLIKNVSMHLCQSDYAYKHLAHKGWDHISGFEGQLYSLPDFIGEEFIEKAEQSPRKDIVLYNPNKGMAFTKKIMAAAPDIKFVPIRNMDRDKVISLMRESKLYIDFGFHPGKDKLPRESAMCGCCIITGKRGTAGNEVDIPIPIEFKFQDVDKAIPSIICED